MPKRKKSFLPKRVGRLKVPKRIRRGLVGEAIASAAGQAVIAALILKAGSRLKHRLGGSRREADGDGIRPLTDFADDELAGPIEPSSPHPPARPAAPRGPTLNVSHALGQAALAFILGLSHPKSSPRAERDAPKFRGGGRNP